MKFFTSKGDLWSLSSDVLRQFSKGTVRGEKKRMSVVHAKEIQKKGDLIQWIKLGVGQQLDTSRRERRHGLVIVPGGGGKTTLVEKLKASSICCADSDQYWETEKDREEEKVTKMIREWQAACRDKDIQQRWESEDEFVLFKAEVCREKWSRDDLVDLLFIQTTSSSSILLTDDQCSSLNRLPTDAFHQENLHRRRQWKENEEEKTCVLYGNFEEFERIVRLFHQMNNTSIYSVKREIEEEWE